MVRLKYLTLILSGLLAGCQDYDIIQSAKPHFPEGSVGFTLTSMKIKGAPVMQLPELTEFRVIAYRHEAPWESVNASAPASVFMDHIAVTQTDGYNWIYTPLKYWPAEDNISFFAYAPQAATDGTYNKYGLSITTPTDGNAPEISYKVPRIVEDQPDLMVSITQNYNLNKTADGSNGVNMDFAHALTCVGFNATGGGERILEVKVTGVIGEGSIVLGGSTVNWKINPDDTSYEFTAGVNDEPLDDNPSSILNGDGYLMMIPQTLTDNAMVVITVDGGDQIYEQTFSLNIPGNREWVAGRFIEYQFAVTPTKSIIISPESLVLTALAKAYSSFSIICPEEEPDAEWTVTAPEGGWLEICDNTSGINNTPQANKYTYSGRGSRILYAFAPSANNTAEELASEIRLAGSGQKINVAQLYKDQIYYPEDPHGGWAGSNIYWVADNSYPAGGYLTFDDKDVTTHEQYQGVYFMWGSLVALSPMGTSWTGGIWNGSTGQVLYIPNPNQTTNGGWDPAANNGWGYIPRMGWTNESRPNNGGSAIYLDYNALQSYIFQNHNPEGNIGDICKYLTDMGWAPGAHEGRRWRMPTHKDFDNTVYDYTRVGSFAYQDPTNSFGTSIYAMGFRRVTGIGTPFYPASGFRYPPSGSTTILGKEYRPGESFSYWSSSPNKTNGDAFDYILGNSGTTNTQGFGRNTGSAIRCVMESDRSTRIKTVKK